MTCGGFGKRDVCSLVLASHPLNLEQVGKADSRILRVEYSSCLSSAAILRRVGSTVEPILLMEVQMIPCNECPWEIWPFLDFVNWNLPVSDLYLLHEFGIYYLLNSYCISIDDQWVHSAILTHPFEVLIHKDQ